MRAKLLLAVFVFITFLGFSQNITGIVLDAKTKKPIETATVYFNNTTRGVITDAEGHFSIKYSNAIQSPLIISFLGYEKQIITDYRTKHHLNILLKETNESLDEVIVNANDGLTRKQKLRFFRREFLGTSKFGKSCKILNEDDLILRYNKKERVLYAHAKAPLKIENSALQYVLNYDISFFYLEFSPLSINDNGFITASVSFVGNSYYQDFDIINTKKAIKNRDKAYLGSKQKFMRALYQETLEDHKFEIFNGDVKVNPSDYFVLKDEDNNGIKEVYLQQPVNILYKKWEKSSIQFLVPNIRVDIYGNYSDVPKVKFTGVMGQQRIGDFLPFDYGLNYKKG